MKNKKYFTKVMLLSSLLLLDQSIAWADTAISVPKDVRETIENAKSDFNNLEARKIQNEREAGYKKDASDWVERAGNSVAQLKSDLQSAKARLERARLEIEQAAVAKEEAQASLNEAKIRQQAMQQQVQDAYDAAAAASQRANALVRASWDREAEIQRLVDSGAALPGAPEEYIVDWSATVRAQNRAEQLLADARRLDAENAGSDWRLGEKTDKLIAAESRSASAKQELAFAMEAEAAYTEALGKAEDNLSRAVSMQGDLLYKLAHPSVYSFSAFDTGLNFYSWRSGSGSGYQMVQPWQYRFGKDNYSFRLSTAYVMAHNGAAGRDGSINTLTDTKIDLFKRVEHKQYSVDYLFNLTLPTGSASLNAKQRNARMSDDLVELDPYGKGWQMTPGIQMNWQQSETIKWTAGTGYLFGRSYDQTSDIPGDTVSPGYEWRKFLRYQLAEKKRQFVAEIVNTSYGRTTYQNNNSYHLKDGWNYRLTYNKVLDDTKELLFYYWLENAGRNDQGAQNTNNAYTQYFGSAWSKKVNAKDTLKLSFDVMRTNGNRYDGLQSYTDALGNPQYYYVEVMGRTKYTFSLGYERKINANDRWSAALQYFKMRDGASTIGDAPKNYNGFIFSLFYHKAL